MGDRSIKKQAPEGINQQLDREARRRSRGALANLAALPPDKAHPGKAALRMEGRPAGKEAARRGKDREGREEDHPANLAAEDINRH